MIDNNGGMMGEILETGQNTVKSVGDAAKQGVKSTASSTVSQVTGKSVGQGVNEVAAAQAAQQKMSDDQAKDFLKGLYGKSDPLKKNMSSSSSSNNSNPVAQALGVKPKDPNAGKTPEEIAQMLRLRMQLHSSEYYQPLVNPRKQKEEPVAEKLEREKKEEQFELAEKEKKKPPKLPVTVKQGTGEMQPGVAG